MGDCSSKSAGVIRVIRVCRKCGAKIFSDAPKGLCTACVLETALGIFPDASVAADQENEAAKRRMGESARSPSPRFSDSPFQSVPMLGELGDYELLEEIGRGGQGVVFRARQKSLNRTVALKIIGLGQWASKAHVKRFRLEAEAAARLDNPCIVPIYEVGERDGSCYFSMKFVEGGQLDEVVKRTPMSVRQAVELMAKVARTVHYAHEHGILHRDIKPGNILLDQNGEPHLTDFGLARLVESESSVTHTLEVLGTPSYMAPEQAAGNNTKLTSATDIYGLGAVFYQLLTGHPPFAGGTTYETIKLVLETEPRQPRLWNPKIDRDLSTICVKCLEKDPARRYDSALALAEDLEHWLGHEPIRARHTGVFTRGKKLLRRNPTTAALIALSLAFAATVGVMIWKAESERPPPAGIAVLPFENLSDEKEHAFFADGVQDDILTKLAKVADLKVISRTSVMQYRGKQDVRQIGNALRVSHVLEGTVRRFGGKVHVNAQLVDARTDRGVWAEEYDRDLNDVFAIEAELAQSIANRLRAKVSAREKAAMQEWPTKDLVAYDFYARATPLIDKAKYKEGKDQAKDYFQAVELLNQAIARDPAFLLAYCRLAEAHDAIHFQGIDDQPGRLALAKAAIDSAFRLKPDSGEAHLALATHLYHGYLDYDHARDELAIAVRTLPNDARIFQWSGYIDRRQGRWHDAVRNFERATALDPRNEDDLEAVTVTYYMMRAYKQAKESANRLIALKPNDIHPQLFRARIAAHERADTRPLHTLMEKILTHDPAAAATLGATGDGEAPFTLALWERDPVAADRALAALTENYFEVRWHGVDFTRGYAKGLIAQLKGDEAAAGATFSAARAEVETLRVQLRIPPDDDHIFCILGLIDAGLGRKEEALREGRRALELRPVTKDAINGADLLYFYAVICAQAGERDLAIEQLDTLARIPAGASYGELRLDPAWDPLRGDPRFEKIVASLAPK
jgi:TolB-like protein/Flp pilus assembly protein TadD